MGAVEAAYSEREARTAFLSTFLSALGVVALLINLILTPLIHKKLGVIFGLTAQPAFLMIGVLVYFFSPAVWSGALLKISDRGLSYSVNRASKELLYVPLDPKLIYQSKAWIDMFGYRFFKVLGSIIILSLTDWFAFSVTGHDLSYVTFVIICMWLWVIKLLRREYQKLTTG
jgi:AAA family ATP:ADP antiporter